jgi:hypothetical protein
MDGISIYYMYNYYYTKHRGCRDRMVVGFTTIYAISAYHHKRCEFEERNPCFTDRIDNGRNVIVIHNQYKLRRSIIQTILINTQYIV